MSPSDVILYVQKNCSEFRTPPREEENEASKTNEQIEEWPAKRRKIELSSAPHSINELELFFDVWMDGAVAKYRKRLRGGIRQTSLKDGGSGVHALFW